MASGPIISWQIERERVETVTTFISLGSKITVDGDCNLGRKAVTNLDSVLNSRHITLLTKVCIVKTMLFPVVMYGCKSWIINKAEHCRIDVFKQVLEKTLESPLDCKEIKPVNCKGNQH